MAGVLLTNGLIGRMSQSLHEPVERVRASAVTIVPEAVRVDFRTTLHNSDGWCVGGVSVVVPPVYVCMCVCEFVVRKCVCSFVGA
jgi:hypothetical protein